MNSLAAVSDVNQRGSRTFAPVGRADGDRVFRAAVRHSRRIRILRVLVPGAVVVVVLGGLGVAALLKPLRALTGVPVDVGSLVVSGTKIMMQQPRLAGFTRDNRRYNMTAQAAGQDLTKPDMVELHGINATMEMKDGVVFETTAKTGSYNTKAEQLTLHQNIVVTSSSGYQAFLSEAIVDVRAGKVASDKPVEVRTEAWTINANRMEILDSGDLMRFERGVTVLLLPDTPAPTTTSGVPTSSGERKR
jgi:lipopolysaccharide export system protein LptC